LTIKQLANFEMDADIEKKQEPTPNGVASGEAYGQIIATQGKMRFFSSIIDGFRENPKCVLAERLLRG
jgi:hypothetical protein